LSFAFPQFNPALGTLDSVTWTFTDSEYDYLALFTPNFSDYETINFSTTESISILGVDITDSQQSTWTFFANNGDCMCISSEGAQLDASGTIQNDTPFIGPGYVQIQTGSPVVSISGLDGSPDDPDTTDFFGDDGDNGAFTITYTVTPVPEPNGGIAFLAIAFLGALGLKKYR
jgi:hypothetical protein